MRLVTYSEGVAEPRLGVRVGHRVLDVEAAARVQGEPLAAPGIQALLREGRGALARVQALARAAQSGSAGFSAAMYEQRAVRLHAPLTDPRRLARVRIDSDGALAFDAPLAQPLLGHAAKLPLPPAGQCAVALAFVLSRSVRGVPDDAFDCIAGVTLAIDGGERLVLGPELVTIDEIADVDDLWIMCAVNGADRLRASVGDGVARLAEILGALAADAALEPGDLVALVERTPVALAAGDVVDCGIEGLATLRATVVAAQ